MSKVVSLRDWVLGKESDRKAQLIIEHFKEMEKAYKDAGLDQTLQQRNQVFKTVAKLVKGSTRDSEQ